VLKMRRTCKRDSIDGGAASFDVRLLARRRVPNETNQTALDQSY
jgi:hypothetical protein